MAIKKVQHSGKRQTKETAKAVPVAANLEEKRQKFQESVKKGKDFSTRSTSAKSRTAKHSDSPSKHGQNKHHSHKKRSLIIAVAAFLVVVGTVGMSYLYFWAQAPQRVVVDSLLSALAAPSARYDGTLQIGNGKPSKFTGTFAGNKMHVSTTVDTTFSGDLSKMTMAMMASGNDMYFKIDKASRFIEVTTQGSSTATAITPAVKKQIDDRWVKLNETDYHSLSPLMQLSTCVNGFLQKITADRSMRASLLELYTKHQFLTITETTPFTAMVGEYRLSLDAATLKDFTAALSSSSLMDSFDSCKKQLATLALSDESTTDLTITVNKASRTLQSIRFVSAAATRVGVDLRPTFSNDVSVVVPADSTEFDKVESPIYKQYVTSTLQQLGHIVSFAATGK